MARRTIPIIAFPRVQTIYVCLEKMRQLVFTRSSGPINWTNRRPYGDWLPTEWQTSLCQEVTSPLKLQWYEYLTLASSHLYRAKVLIKLKKLDRHNRSLFRSSAFVFISMFYLMVCGYSFSMWVKESVYFCDYSRIWYRFSN